MRKNKTLIGICIAAMVLLFAFAGNTLAQEAKTIVVTVNEDGDLVDQSGTVYFIDEGVISDEDALNSDAVFHYSVPPQIKYQADGRLQNHRPHFHAHIANPCDRTCICRRY